ncbi:ribonucleases P/MRP protein subunit POP1 isoform X2 [Nymphaea colorata]|uniref:ribonucleases P/MRP protein subunit POP1 isoform X2 n=1 Tax=Nymphaea colorata TaxID=210225 RepID=UPI00129D36D9|nr:ribonucleases P/MRP protein subunit POP1 isoform X2 [Nymphaea colorata]
MAGEQRPPPRVLNVQRFADARSAELQSLHAIVAERVGSDFRVPRRTRRRTSSFLNRRNPNCRTKSKKRKRQVGQVSGEDGSTTDPEVAKEKKCQNRRVRRRMEFKGNPISGFSLSGDGTKRLRTHVWHAKRFEMVKRWGFYLPLGLSGRGRGSRSILKQLRSECFIHDASYFSTVQLEGAEKSILTILDEVLVPPPSSIPEEYSKPILNGASYGQSMLYHAGADSQAISPVTYMWRPLVQTSTHPGTENGATDVHDFLYEKKKRQLWIWLHAASFKEGFDALGAACGRQMHADGVGVNCVSREGELGRLELFGSTALKICQKLLKPMREARNNAGCSKLVSPDVGEEGTNSTFSESFNLEHAEDLASHAILSLSVVDPRVVPVKETTCPWMGPKVEPIAQNGSLEENNGSCWEATGNKIEAFMGTWFEHEWNCLVPDSKELWESSAKNLSSPMEESLLCAEKHQRRLSSFFMDKKNQEICTSKSTNNFSRFCPILLLRNSQKDVSFLWWSIILPINWIKAFWISMVSHGAHAIGLRERRWIACEAKLPSFPYDFPDCKAYADHMACEAVAFDKKVEALPPSRRLMRIPIPPPWNCIKLPREGRLLTQSNEVSPCLLTGVNVGLHDDRAFQGFVARTSASLLGYVNDIHVDDMILYPDTATKGSCAEIANGTSPNWTTSGASTSPVIQKGCFVRTVLYANKRGVFEEGASVCVPTSDDYSLWSRPNEQEQLQIPLILLRSYFTQQSFHMWQMQVPESPGTRQFHRQLIGFVTTDFVRGSVKPAAEALCEASMLAQLSKEQPTQKGKGKNQIMVLVRNPRSTVYRPGLATVVLQQQEDDLSFV